MVFEFDIFRVEADSSTTFMGLREPRMVAASLPGKRVLRKAPCARLHTVLASASLLLCMVPTNVLAQQQVAGRETSSRSLPDAPLAKKDPQNSAQQAPLEEGSASVAGTVLDMP